MQERTIPAEWPDNLKLITLVQMSFTKRWEPYGRYEREQFHCELLELVHLIYREAQQPALKQLGDIINRLPFSIETWPPSTKPPLPPEVK